jgi:hypothetical protein
MLLINLLAATEKKKGNYTVKDLESTLPGVIQVHISDEQMRIKCVQSKVLGKENR